MVQHGNAASAAVPMGYQRVSVVTFRCVPNPWTTDDGDFSGRIGLKDVVAHRCPVRKIEEDPF